jgi:hypothetical protein
MINNKKRIVGVLRFCEIKEQQKNLTPMFLSTLIMTFIFIQLNAPINYHAFLSK